MVLTSNPCVLIAAQRTDGPEQLLGTGTVVAPGRVLTARHVVWSEPGEAPRSLVVRREGEGNFRPATIRWGGSPALDVAVLEAELEGAPKSHPLTLLSGRDFGGGLEWGAEGYPAVREESPSQRRETVRGKTCSYRRGDRDLSLDVEASPDQFGGLSGAAVVVGGQIVGVVRAVPKGWNKKRLEATPVAAFYNAPEFLEAIGQKPVDKGLADDLLLLEKEIREQLQRLPRVLSAIAEALDTTFATLAKDDLAAEVARVLVHARTGVEVVRALRQVDDALMHDASRAGERLALQGLLWQVLPLASDWREWVRVGRAALENKTPFVDLPLGTLTMAEAVIAGIDRRPCRYNAQTAFGPTGFALLRKPATEHVPYLDLDRQGLVKATVGLLATTLFNLAPDAPELRDHAAMKTQVNGKLRYFLDARRDKRVPRWLLLDDQRPDGRGATGEGAEDRLAVAVAVLGEELPHLRILRMGAGTEDETYLALHIGDLWEPNA